ncbi:MAG TPA: BrnA antitoxin family protein [Terriglobales bacterium]|nr:BrnA antitoxin family protein [Terriglobales bacterium]
MWFAASGGALSQPGEQIATKGKLIKTTSAARTKGKTDWKRLREMRDSQIDYSDVPKLGKSFWNNAQLVMPEPKDRLTIRIDHDVVEWLKKQGSGYQTRINAILRSYMLARSGKTRIVDHEEV